MSSSSKKQLRREQVAAKKAEQQQTAMKESKKLKVYTSIFCIFLALMILLVAVVSVNNSGLIEPRVTALTVGETKVSAAELNIYYIAAISSFVESNGNYLPMFGLNTNQPLDRQLSMDATNTWADYFINIAKENIQNEYSIYNAAIAAGKSLSEDDLDTIDGTITLMKEGLAKSGSSLNEYLRSIYGKGVTEKTYRRVLEVSTLATAYYNEYVGALTYTDADIAAKDAEDPTAGSMYSYTAYVMYASDYLEGGTEDENGNVTYSEAENAAALAACEAVAKTLASGTYTDVGALKAAIEKLPVSDKESASSTTMSRVDDRATSVLSSMKEWVTDPARLPGDITYVEQTTTIDGVSTVSGYNVVMFEGVEDNNYPLANVRHILVSFEGGTKDETTGVTTYSDDEKAAAKAKAQDIYDAWLAGEATEDSFAALATEKTTDPGSKENGGLYEDVYPGQMVTAFDAWCFDEARKAGDHGMVETDYGYHVMFYSGDSETTYRSFLLENDMLNADIIAWQEDLLEKAPVTDKNLSRVDSGLVLGSYLYYGYQ